MDCSGCYVSREELDRVKASAGSLLGEIGRAFPETSRCVPPRLRHQECRHLGSTMTSPQWHDRIHANKIDAGTPVREKSPRGSARGGVRNRKSTMEALGADGGSGKWEEGGPSWCPGLGSNLTLTKHHSVALHGANGPVLMASLALARGPLGKHEGWASIGDQTACQLQRSEQQQSHGS